MEHVDAIGTLAKNRHLMLPAETSEPGTPAFGGVHRSLTRNVRARKTIWQLAKSPGFPFRQVYASEWHTNLVFPGIDGILPRRTAKRNRQTTIASAAIF
jgi:hypothetical protein